MTTAPPQDQLRLLDVQALDTRAAQLAHRRSTLPALARLAELAAQVSDLDAALVASRTAASDLRRELAKAETDVEQVRSRAQRDQARLDSGAGTAKDVQALSSELGALARRQGELEEVQLEVMERLEAHEAALAELESARAQLGEQQAAAQAELAAGRAEVDAEVASVTAERAAAVAGLDAALLALYERLRGQLSGRGAAALVGGTCEGCRMQLNPRDLATIAAAPPDQVVRCEECGRILVRTERSGL